ncbi:MAG: glycosyltransferase family 4 protein [Holosporales bacterium]|jgi:glycosyltransferase involved in cell wall biosynthesis|nr:glycosyltransferase family 4 protein [Holosporales bacterium]
MHIALVISSLSSGGAERVLSELANRIVEKENSRVSLITFSAENAKPFYPLSQKIKLIQLNQSKNETFYLIRLKNIIKRVLCLRKMFKKLKLDAIISFVDIANITTLIAATGISVPVIVSERTSPQNYKIPRLYQRIRRLFYPRAVFVLIQTESCKDYFHYLDNIKIIPNAAMIPACTKKEMSSEVKNIVSTGRLHPHKDFDVLINAFKHLSERFPNIKLTIYGEGPERVNLEKLVESLNIQNRVFLPGVVSDIHSILADADLFVFPSRYEGFPNALCEAMAVGLPVIASDCAGNVDVVRDNIDGRFFPVGSIRALTELMTELLNDYEQRKRLSGNAKSICNRFHPDKIFAMWDRLLNEAVRPH